MGVEVDIIPKNLQLMMQMRLIQSCHIIPSHFKTRIYARSGFIISLGWTVLFLC